MSLTAKVFDKARHLRDMIVRQDKAIYHAFASVAALRVVEKLCGLVISIFIFRFLSVENVAHYGFIQTIVAICAIFGIQEFQGMVLQSVSRGFLGTYLKAVPIAFACSLIGTLILCGFSLWYYIDANMQMAQGFLIAGAVFPFFQGLQQWKGFYQGEANFSGFAKAEASNAIIKMVLMVAALYYLPHEIIGPLLVFFAVPALQNIFRTFTTIRKIDKDAPYEEGSLTYGFKANLYAASGTVAAHIDKVILFAFLPPASLALYMAAEKFSDLLSGMAQDMASILAPKFAKTEHYSTALDNKLKILAGIMGVGIIGFAFLILPHLLPLVFGQTYKDSVFFAQVLICGTAFRNIASLRFRFIKSKIDEVSFRRITLYSSAGHIAASVILVPMFGLYGAVASVFLQRLIVSMIVSHVIKTRYLSHER